MSEQLPAQLVFNGIHGRTGKYLLSLTPDQLMAAARGFKLRRAQRCQLEDNANQRAEENLTARVGLDQNDLSQVGWGLILPGAKRPKQAAALLDHLALLLEHRRKEAGEHLKLYVGSDGYLPGDTADKFMRRHGGSPGIYDPEENRLPYYLLIIGSPEEVPFSFQYELDATYLVGRLDFGDNLGQYAQYAKSVAAAEDKANGLRLPRRLVFFGTQHLGDTATLQSCEDLVIPLAGKLQTAFAEQDWQLEIVTPNQARRRRLEELLGNGDAPALLFTATHGLGFDAGDPVQEAQQGALLCQDFGAYGEPILRDHFVAAEDITDDFSLHGMIAFHFACFGAGTPAQDSFPRVSRQLPKQIARRDFTAALPQRLLSHPKGGALAVIGHIDRAWTYSFKWGETTKQTATFYDTLARIMLRDRVGVALDSFNLRYAQIALKLAERLNLANIMPPDTADLGSLWTGSNDARGYALLGDPAIRLPVTAKGELPAKREQLSGIVMNSQHDEPEKASTTELSYHGTTAASVAETPADVGSMPAHTWRQERYGRPVVVNVTPQGHVTITVNEQEPEHAAPMQGVGAFGVMGFDQGNDEPQGWKSTLQQVLDSFGKTVQALGDKLTAAARDVSELEVRTYVSEDIGNVQVEQGAFKGDVRQRAVTLVKLDGDIDQVVPVEADEINQALWEIHRGAVEQAQANRQALLQAMVDLVAGFVPRMK